MNFFRGLVIGTAIALLLWALIFALIVVVVS